MKIRTNIRSKEISVLIYVAKKAVKIYFKNITEYASPGVDRIPPKLAKLAREYLVKPLKEAINSSIRHSVFPNNAKRAAVTPLDKGAKDKNSVNNYRPVSILNFFSKFYEKIIKQQVRGVSSVSHNRHLTDF